MQNRKRDTDVQNRLLDSVGEARVGCSERIALKKLYYQGWNRSPAQVGCKRQVLRAGALGRPRGMGWGGRWEGVSGWGTHVNPWLIHVNVWQKPLQYYKVISLQLIKINEKKKPITYFFKQQLLLWGINLCNEVKSLAIDFLWFPWSWIKTPRVCPDHLCTYRQKGFFFKITILLYTDYIQTNCPLRKQQFLAFPRAPRRI